MSKPSPNPDQTGRALAAIEHIGQVATARSGALRDTGMNRVWDLGTVARIALRETERLTAYETELAKTTPHAAARLRLITATATVALARLVTQTAQPLPLDYHTDDDHPDHHDADRGEAG